MMSEGGEILGEELTLCTVVRLVGVTLLLVLLQPGPHLPLVHGWCVDAATVELTIIANIVALQKLNEVLQNGSVGTGHRA